MRAGTFFQLNNNQQVACSIQSRVAQEKGRAGNNTKQTHVSLLQEKEKEKIFSVPTFDFFPFSDISGFTVVLILFLIGY